MLKEDIDIEFQNIYNRETDRASCSLLRIGEIKILFDCGCNEKVKDSHEFDNDSDLRRVAAAAATVNYIFISHATIQHVGALPFLHKIGVLANPNLKDILATSPVAKVGAQTMYEFAI